MIQLITLSGVDGSGKSTQLTLLKTKLEQEGKKVFYFHAVEFSLANKLARVLKGEKEFIPGKEKASMQASWFSLQLRKLFLLIDIFRFRALKQKLAREHYNYILSDRYFYDSVINILYLSKSDVTLFLETYILKPDKAFYFQITAEEIMHRERVPEQGIEYLREKIALFEQKKDVYKLIPIDASLEKSEIANTLVHLIND